MQTDSADSGSLFEADLAGETNGSGNARYEVSSDGADFSIEVESGVPGETLDIVVDGVVVDQLTLDDLGNGEVEYSDPPDDSADSNELAFPGDFPDVGDGTEIEVGDLSGALSAVVDESGDDSNDNGDNDDSSDNENDASRSLFEADLTGATDASGRARYEVRSDRTDFSVEVESGVPQETLDIVVDGVVVDQLTLDDLGNGEVEYRDPPDDSADSNELAFPDNFPEISEGSEIAVGNLSGGLAPSE